MDVHAGRMSVAALRWHVHILRPDPKLGDRRAAMHDVNEVAPRPNCLRTDPALLFN
jgi:hypothetical protein